MPINFAFAEISGQPIISAANTFENLAKSGIDVSSVLHKCNSYRCGLGDEPGRAYLFMLRRDVERLARAKSADAAILKTHKLNLGTGGNGGPTQEVTIPGLIFIRAHRLIPGYSQDPKALYVVELADKRWLADRSFINRRFNLRKTNGSDADYVESTTNSGTPWTWAELIEEIWSEVNQTTVNGSLQPIIGTYSASKVPIPTPALTTTPANIRYDDGRSAWRALCDAVRRVGLEMVYDPLAGEFRAVQMGNGTPWSGANYAAPSLKWEGGVDSNATINKLTDGETKRRDKDLLLEDSEVIVGAYAYPKSVTVLFPIAHVSGDLTAPIFDVKGLFYPVVIEGSSLTELGNDAVYVAPAAQAANDTTLTIHDQTPAQFDDVDDDEPTNQDDLEDRAREVAGQYYRSLLDDLPGRWVFSGVRKFIPGQFIAEVVWRDFGDGLKTEVVRYQPKRPEPQPRPPFVLSEDPDDNDSSGSGCRCCDPFNCIDPGVGIPECSICDCSANPWIAQLPTINCTTALEGAGGTVVGGWRAMFFNAEATGDGESACVWQTGEFETDGRTFNWKMTVQAGMTAVLQLLEVFEDDTFIILGEWFCSRFCCRCENRFEAACPAYLPVPCFGLPASVCVSPKGTYRAVTSGCEILELGDLPFCQDSGIAKFWFANLDGFSDCNCGSPDWCDALAGNHLVMTVPDDCDWTGTILYSAGDGIHPYTIIASGFSWDGAEFSLTFFFTCDTVSGQLTYRTNGGFNCLASNTLEKVGWTGTELFDTVPDTITIEPAGILSDDQGDPILDANGNTIFDFDQDSTDCTEPEGGCCVFLRWFGTGTGYGAGGSDESGPDPSWRWLNVTAGQGHLHGCGIGNQCASEDCDVASLPDPAGSSDTYLVIGCT